MSHTGRREDRGEVRRSPPEKWVSTSRKRRVRSCALVWWASWPSWRLRAQASVARYDGRSRRSVLRHEASAAGAGPRDNPQTGLGIPDNALSSTSDYPPTAVTAPPATTPRRLGRSSIISEGVGGARTGRNSPTVLNTAFNQVQFWDGRAPTLEAQAVGPIQNPVEMKMTLPACIACIEGSRDTRRSSGRSSAPALRRPSVRPSRYSSAPSFR